MRLGIYIVCQLAFSVTLTTVLCLGSVLSPRMANATVYYVATTGNDSRSCATAQTISTPKATITSGITCLSAGDTLYIRGGIYNESISVPEMTVPSGTSWSNAITIAGYPNETVVMQGANLQDNTNRSIISYLIFDNLIMDAGGSPTQPDEGGGAFRTAGNTHHIRVQNSELRNANGMLIFSTEGPGFIEIVNNRIHDAYVSKNPAYSVTTGYYGMYVKFHNSLIEGNTIYNCSGYGIHLYGSGLNSVSDNIIRNNIFYNTGFDDGGRNDAQSAVIISSGSNNQFYNNIVYGNPNVKNGAAVSVAYTNGGTNNQIYNNTIYGNAGAGIEVHISAPGTVVRNNIVYGNGGGTIIDWGATGTVQSNNLTIDPQFANASANDFSLRAGSPAIDAGAMVSTVTTDIKGTARPQGAACDIGAYEYYTGSTPLPTPRNLRLVTVSP